MLPKKHKLNKNLFNEVFQKGLIYHSDFFYLKLFKQENMFVSRFSVVVSKKMFKKSVDRNKIKRQTFFVLRNNLPQIKDGFCGIFFLKKGVAQQNFKTYRQDIEKLLKKSGLIL